jgi:thiamine biosynthesis lipoprotein
MKETRLIMSMPITIEVIDNISREQMNSIFNYFREIDARFSVFKRDSEISKLNRGEITFRQCSLDLQTVLELCAETKGITGGYFDIKHNSKVDPSGLVKGWAIHNAAELLRGFGIRNFYVDAGGDIEVSGHNKSGGFWKIGIRNPFNRNENVKIVELSGKGIATSGTAIRGQHIYNPRDPQTELSEIVSITVIGPDIYEADRFATAAFAMQKEGIYFIESLAEFAGYAIDKKGNAKFTNNFTDYVFQNVQMG